MIECNSFYAALQKNGISFFTGVPDSLLKGICAYITDHAPNDNHVIAANEGAAIGLAIGYHLATGNIPLVYLQNSGLGNTINPLLTLADPEVYNIPLILLIGWRGEPSVKDEPQHVKQGRINRALLESMEIPYAVLPDENLAATQAVAEACAHLRNYGGPYALVVRKGSFGEHDIKSKIKTHFSMCRETAIKTLLDELGHADIVVSTTGMASRELFEYREALSQGHNQDFLTIGGMGHSSQIALGIAMQKRNRKVICLDGDGSIIMHMGSLAIIGQQMVPNYIHVVMNNGAHDSVGGQPTVGLDIDFGAIARGSGYHQVLLATEQEEAKNQFRTLLRAQGPGFLEVKINKGARSDLGRPTTSPQENKAHFMSFLRARRGKNFTADEPDRGETDFF